MSLDVEFEQVQKWLANSPKTQVSSGHRLLALYESGRSLDIVPELADVQSKCSWSLRHILEKLVNIQIASIQAQAQFPDKNVISISLHDMKSLNALMHLLVVEGIYPCLDQGVGLPLRLRTKGVPGVTPQDNTDDKLQFHSDLNAIVTTLRQLLDTKGDVRDLLLLGTYNGDIICAGAQLDHNSNTTTTLPQLIQHIDTYSLYATFTSLMRPGAPKWFIQTVSYYLARLPLLRKDAIASLIEFAGSLREKDQVSIGQLQPAIRVLKSVPQDVDSFYEIVDEQLFDAVAKIDSPIAVSAAHIIGVLFREKPEAVRPLCTIFCNKFVAKGLEAEQTITRTIDALCTICKDAGASDFVAEIRSRLLVNLWAMTCFVVETKRANRELLEELFVSLLHAGSSNKAADDLMTVTTNLLIQGVYAGGSSGGVIGRAEQSVLESGSIPSLENVDERVSLFMSLVQKVKTPALVSGLFVRLIQEWLSQKTRDAFVLLVYARVLESLAESCKEDLVQSSSEVVDLVVGIVHNFVASLKSSSSLLGLGQTLEEKLVIGGDHDSDDEDMDVDGADEEDDEHGPVKLSISLLPHLLDTPEEIASACEDLNYIKRHGPSPLVQLASKTLDDLERIELSAHEDEIKETDSSSQAFVKALNSLSDASVPVRAHGLHVIRQLIRKDSTITSQDMACKVYVNALKDDDSFIYLNAIRGLETCATAYGAHPVLQVLLGRYADDSLSIDERLRNGEAIQRIIEIQSKTMVGECANEVSDTMVDVISHRKNDMRLRMSALSIVGAACQVNAQELSKTWVGQFVDCAIGILTFETSDDATVLRRASVVLIGSLVQGIDTASEFPRAQVETVITRLQYAKDHDKDSLVQFQSEQVLGLIAEKFNI